MILVPLIDLKFLIGLAAQMQELQIGGTSRLDPSPVALYRLISRFPAALHA
jgi:hypothetical protein